MQLDRTKRIYFGEETEAEMVRDKAKSAEDKAKGRKKDMSSLFKSKAALKKQAGLLSAKEDELNIRSTGARNDYILNLSSSNAHQERYYKHDLQVCSCYFISMSDNTVETVYRVPLYRVNLYLEKICDG